MNKLILAILLPLSLYAQDFSFNKKTGKAVPNFVGELKLMKGSALKTTGGRPRPVKTGEKFYPKDSVATEENSSMKILITDDTWIALGPSSELVFKDFEFTDKSNRKIHYELKRGQLSANVREKVKSGEVRFISKYSSMGVRGTKIMMNYRELNGKAVTEYALVEGSADVMSSTGESFPLIAGGRIVLIEDEKTKGNSVEKLELTQEDLLNYAAPEADEEKRMDKFMPYFEPKAVNVSKLEPEDEANAKQVEKESDAEGSFNNLKKLNEQLQDNQKRR